MKKTDQEIEISLVMLTETDVVTFSANEYDDTKDDIFMPDA